MLTKRSSSRFKWLSLFLAAFVFFYTVSFIVPAEVHASGTTLVTYPNPPGGAALNTDFTVKVSADGGTTWQDLDEYDTTVGGYHPSHASFVYFDTNGPTVVSVTYNAGTLSSAAVRPASRGITPTINGNTMTFTISGPTKLTVDVNGDSNHNLHLFANPLEVNPPSPSDPNVIYLAPGVYNQDYTVPSGKTLYIAGGAVVKGAVFLDGATNAAVRGRGILDHPSWRGISVNYADTITIDGIIVNDYGMGGGGGDLVDLQNANNVTINNIKGFSYKSWTDGIDNLASTNITVNDCFVRSGDDSMAIYGPRGNAWGNASNETVTNMLLMPDVARPINFGTHGDASDIEGGVLINNMSFSNIDILLNNSGSPMFPIQFTNSSGNLTQNITFTDIRIEDNYVHSIFNINDTWASGENGPGRGVKNIYFKNITYTGTNSNTSNLTGYSSNRMVQDVTFENLVVNGNLILNPAAGNIAVNGNTSNIQFVAPGAGSYTPIPDPTPLYTNLALNGTASSDSELPGHPASGAIDGNYRTDWTANDTNTGHWWEVDLGSNKTINGTKVIWNSNSVNYLYKIEVSTDNTNWTTVVDRTASNGTAKTNNDFFNATARYVRITVTGLSTGASAGFNEFRVYGYNGTTLVKNGDFENGNTATWTGVGQATSVSAAANGTFGVELKNPGYYMEQTITGLSPNTAYVLTVNGKGVSGTGQGYIYVKDYGGAQLNQSVVSNNNWNSTTISFVTGPTSTSATIGASCTATRVQFDDFSLSLGPVLVQNGDFETGNITGWTGSGAAAQVWAADHGTYGLELANPGNYAEQTITGLSPNTSYVMTVNTKGVSGTGQGSVYVKNYGGTQISKNITSDNNWHSVAIYFITGPTTTSATIGANCTTTRVQYDDFTVNRSPVLVQNGNFETGNTSGWTGSGLAAYTYAAANGSYGLQLTNPGNYAEQTITGLTPNTSYTLTVNTKGVSGTGQGYVYVKNYGGTQINQNIVSNNNWNSMTISFTTGATSTSATIGAYCTATRVQFDDFVLNPS